MKVHTVKWIVSFVIWEIHRCVQTRKQLTKILCLIPVKIPNISALPVTKMKWKTLSRASIFHRQVILNASSGVQVLASKIPGMNMHLKSLTTNAVSVMPAADNAT